MGSAATVGKAPLLVWWMLQIYLLVAAVFCEHGGFIVARAAASNSRSNSFKFGFYDESCPDAEKIVTSVVEAQFRSNPGIVAGVLRMHFHDCFVEGCDGSVLLDPTTSNPKPEKTAFPNLTLRGFEVIDEAKKKLEAACPGIVSCADIVAFAARDSVQVTGGPGYKVKSGRRDGRVSLESQALADIPAPQFNASELIQSFAAKGLSVGDMVTLSGAHTIGRSHCSNFAPIRSNDIDAAFAKSASKACPTASVNKTVFLDGSSPNYFDNSYFKNLPAKKGLLFSDESLSLDSRTSNFVLTNANDASKWKKQFVRAILKMGTTDLKLAGNSDGEIRKNCRQINAQ
ncbi:hypothetical protein CY35_19G056900 [Sphagnum magellanicum]|nr:hypothetical protein CY35_19G056900 [Sphagnum magellanicum]